ncbi:dGTPase [Shewanella sp. YIC-542]|uniref:dGTPase n=1 Tax=Shewanella mytili TaxID=3377111 RepID=UPI00398ED562
MVTINFARRITLARPYNHPTHAKQEIAALQRAYESDRGRIINSAAIRRLQQKTQVFPLERNAAVRSRLTHSLEVQQTGRFIVQKIFDLLSQQQVALSSLGLTGMARPLETLVEMACLMHDVGNPPFGHFGEAAISDWFERHFDTMAPDDFQQHTDLRRDICHFEGNAQGLRLMHTLLGLNLTYSQLAGILKYTRCGTLDKAKRPENKAYLMKKVGYYASESHIVSAMTQALDMAPGNRHPVSYIMEAADDISYCLADIEDAVEKDVISLARLQQQLIAQYQQQCHTMKLASSHHALMAEVIAQAQEAANKNAINPESQFFTFLRVKLIHPLVQHAAQRFIQNIEAIYRGDFNQPLLEDQGHEHAITETLKRVAQQEVFNHKEVEQMELRGYRIVSTLLDCYQPLLRMPHVQFAQLITGKGRGHLIESRLLKRLPLKHLATYKRAITEKALPEYYHRCRLIQDYISGMTDEFALDEYRLLMALD